MISRWKHRTEHVFHAFPYFINACLSFSTFAQILLVLIMRNRWKHRTELYFMHFPISFLKRFNSLTSSPHLLLSPDTLSLIMDSHPLPVWGSLSLIDNGVYVVQKKTGTSFPSALGANLKLCGIGLYRTTVFGLKNIVSAFGVYADDLDIEMYLGEKYGEFDESELKGNKEFVEDLMENDIPMAVRLEIVYDGLSIGSVRSAFEESVGSRLLKFGGSDNKELLQRFTSQFKDEFKIPRGSIIYLSRDKGHVLRTIIDGQEAGSIESKLLCKSILDLYIGEESFDKVAKEDIEFNVASYL